MASQHESSNRHSELFFLGDVLGGGRDLRRLCGALVRRLVRGVLLGGALAVLVFLRLGSRLHRLALHGR